MVYPNFDSLKMQYSWGAPYMTDEILASFVGYGTITADQYKTISGKDYVAPTA